MNYDALKACRLFLLDMDGTLYLGDEVIHGAIDFIHTLEQTGRRYIYLTNNSSRAGTDYVNRLRRLGFPCEMENVFTSGMATGMYLAEEHKGVPVYPVGTPAFLDELRSYPRLVYEQGLHNSFYFSEEPHSTAESPKNIVVTDRATLFNLLVGLGAYTISSGIIHQDASGSRITSVPLESDEIMQIGYLHPKDQPLSRLGQRYLEFLQPYLRQKPPSVSDAGTEPDPPCL